ncbi:MAG: hypothetical protein RLY31_2531 [Bacteroidota bacterium]|jgi:uncharacterized membrane protein YfcA
MTNLLIALSGSFLAGIINTLAGNGSAITLTILTEVMGLPGNVANGTNRIGIATQSIAAARTFQRHGKLDWKRNRLLIITTTFGALIGAWTAIQVSNEQFRAVFRFLMVFMLIVLLVKPERWLRASDLHHRPSHWIAVPAFLALGFYGGFIQMGMGIFFLAVMVLGARYSLLEANAVKSLLIAVYTTLVILLFQGQGLIDWKTGAVMAVGQTLGGWLAARIASRHPSADRWAYRLLVVIVVAAILRLSGWIPW